MHYFVYIITIDSLVYQNDYFVLIVSDYRLVLISISSVTTDNHSFLFNFFTIEAS